MICLSEKYKTGTLLEVSGRSMEPTLWDGQIVEVMEGYHDGDIVVAEHEGSLIIKRLVGDRLLGDNREISTDFFVVDVRILGQAEVRTKEELEERGVQVNCLHLVKVEAISGTRSAYNIPADANWASPESTDGNYYVYGMRDGRRQWVKGAEQIPEDANWVVPDADNLYYIYGMPNGNVSGTPNALDIPADANWASPDNVYDSFDYYVYSMSNGTINRVQGSGRIPGNANWVVPDADNLYYIYSEKKNQFPTISLSTTNNMTLSQGNCVLSGNVIDSDGDTVTISATISGVTKQTTVTGTGGWSLSWPVIDLAQGQYSNIIITANDGRGGTATVNYTGLITIDKTKPSIAISGVSEGQTYTTATPVFSATDAGGAGLQSCTATLNNNAYTSGTPITIGGNYTLVVTARDRAGNVSTKTVNFKVNSAPTVEVSTANNQTLYEGDSLIISGSANDVNVGNALIVKLKFDEEAEKNILVTTSTGNPQPISYTVTFKNGRLYDAAGNPITPELNKDVVHSFTVYAKDDSGAESAHITRQFMVVPNRNPLIRINPLEPLTSMVPTDTVTISGTVNDPDEGDTVTMEYKLNQGPFQP
ncbi:S26 family signal peptidase, partial [Aneurinibacillus migulanus]